MASQLFPKKNAAFTFYISLPSVADGNVFQANPTLATGDAKVSIDGGALADLATLPDVDPNSSKLVKVALSSSEMNGDNIQVILSDAAGGEWKDVMANIQTADYQVNDLAIPTAVIPDSVAADGSRPSINQALLMVTRFLQERAVVGTTMTVKKEDGTTASMTFTLNDAVNPTSITRAT